MDEQFFLDQIQALEKQKAEHLRGLERCEGAKQMAFHALKAIRDKAEKTTEEKLKEASDEARAVAAS